MATEKTVVAMIGSREPTQHQKNMILQALQGLDPETTLIISGCAYGVDALALTHGHNMGFETVGIVPWPSYNTDVQQACTRVYTMEQLGAQHVRDAEESVQQYHPAWSRLSQGAKKLHMRNYGIVRWANKVYAAPSSKPGGGGTGQGIRLAQGLSIPVEIINPQ